MVPILPCLLQDPNQLEGIVKKKPHYYSNSLGDVEPGGMAFLLPVGGEQGKLGRGVPPGTSNPDPIAHFPTLTRDLHLFHGPDSFLPRKELSNFSN